MFGKFIMIFSWILYASLMYTCFVPEHQYLGYIDNARSLYLWIHIPMQIVMTVILAILTFARNSIKEEIPNIVKKLRDKGELEKFNKGIKKFKSFKGKFYLNISRIYYYATTGVVIIVLGDMFLGVVMFWGCAVGLLLTNGLEIFVDAVQEEAK